MAIVGHCPFFTRSAAPCSPITSLPCSVGLLILILSLQSYYTIAAELGDADAQMDLAFCLANGKGCKKNKSEAARWYREAIKQGQSDVGLAWIYKEKYQQ